MRFLIYLLNPQPAKLLKSNTGGGSFCWISIQYAMSYSENTLLHIAFYAILPAGLAFNIQCCIVKKYTSTLHILQFYRFGRRDNCIFIFPLRYQASNFASAPQGTLWNLHIFTVVCGIHREKGTIEIVHITIRDHAKCFHSKVFETSLANRDKYYLTQLQHHRGCSH